MDEQNKDALKELLKFLSENTEIADRIVITIRPNKKPKQSKPPKNK